MAEQNKTRNTRQQPGDLKIELYPYLAIDTIRGGAYGVPFQLAHTNPYAYTFPIMTTPIFRSILPDSCNEYTSVRNKHRYSCLQ